MSFPGTPRRRSWPLDVMGAKYLAVRAQDLKPDEAPLPAHAATMILERAAHYPKDVRQLAALGQAVSQSQLRDTGSFNIGALTRAFDNGFLVLLRRQEQLAVIATRDEVSVEEQVKSAKQVKTWIEMVVVDMEGRPVTNKPYLCVMPDGSTETGYLGPEGKVRFDGIDPGNCIFSLTDLDRDAWERA